MTSCEHAINRLCDFMDNRPALEPTTLSSLVAIRLAKVKMFFIGHVITSIRAESAKRLDGWWPFTSNFYLAKFGSHRSRGSGDI